MESTAPSRSGVSVLVVALLGIALLAAGIGIGYVLWRPAPEAALGPVDGLDRPDTIPLVEGWFRNESVSYYDYGVQPNVTAPILAFFYADSPDDAVMGQRNVIDTIPGQPGYSDFWRVYKVLVPDDYEANAIRSLADAHAAGYAIEATSIVVNCPVVNPDATLSGSAQEPVVGWYRGQEVYYFDHGARSATNGSVVHTAPIYAFFTEDDAPVDGQRNVIDVIPGMRGYSDLWQVVRVIVDDAYEANSLQDGRSILEDAALGQVTLETTSIYVNCPVVS